MTARPAEAPTVVTGATSGVGLAVAEALAADGRPLVLVGRDPVRLQAAERRVRAVARTPPELELADLALGEEVDRLAARLLDRHPQIAALVNDAGGVFFHRAGTAEGVERTWGLNVVAPYRLTRALLPALRAVDAAVVVNVASEAHRYGRLRLDDPEGRTRYRGWSAYAASKIALILLTREFARREPGGSGVRFYAVHPGFVRSRFGHNNPGAAAVGLRLLEAVAGISPARGARPIVGLLRGAIVPSRSGAYVVRLRERRPSPGATDPVAAARVWALLSREADP